MERLICLESDTCFGCIMQILFGKVVDDAFKRANYV